MTIKKTLLLIAAILILLVIGASIYIYKNLSKRSRNLPEVPGISQKEEPQQKTASEDIPRIAVVAKGLEIPWALAFLPNGDLLVTERAGRLRLVDKDRGLLPGAISAVDEVKHIGEGGLLGMTLHPQFEKNHFIYFYYTYDGARTLNRVVRFKLEDRKLSDRTIIVDAIPGAPNHNGGRIKFGPDGFLYITTGDSQEPSLSQDTSSLAGKILRVTDDGKAAPGNPFGNLVYSYGHRNPQGLAWTTGGQLWETEHGSSATDELNRIEIGKNYGWPEIRGSEIREGMVSPILQSGSGTWAPSGTAFLDGSIFFAGLRGQALFEVKNVDGKPTLSEHFKGELGRIREVIVGPDSMLYITTNNRDGRGVPLQDDDKLLRVNPKKL